MLKTDGWKITQVIANEFPDKRFQGEYVTLDCMFKRWRAFKFEAVHRGDSWPKRLQYYHGVYDTNGIWHEANCRHFFDYVDLFCKKSKLYRIY